MADPARLQELLRRFRYGFVVDPPGQYGLTTAWAVREFQIDADSAFVGKEVGTAAAYGDRLVGVPNPVRVRLEVNGIVDEATAAALDGWERHDLRCPVVARLRDRTTRALLADDVWFLPADLGPTPPKQQRLWIKDVSQRYDLPSDRLVDGEVIAGRPLRNGPYAGWTCDRIDSWGGDHAVTVESLTGSPLGDPTSPEGVARRSTYRVVRAVAEVENMGRFDVVNAYDSAVLSLGVMHAALYLGPGSSGELQALWAYARRFADPSDHDRFVADFGVRTEHEWPADGAAAAGNRLYSKGQRKWSSKLMQRGLRVDGEPQPEWTPLTDKLDAEYFRHSHWFWRMLMMGRSYRALRNAQWDLARLRIRDLLASPLEAGSTSTIGSAFTSERAVAALYRAHVNSPGKVVGNGLASGLVRDAAALPEAQRDDAVVAALIAALPNSSMPTALGFVDPAAGALSTAPNSFRLDAKGLDRPGTTGNPVVARPNLVLSGSVGDRGVNRPDEVAAVRQRLRELGCTWISDGSSSAHLADTIRLLQSMVAGRTSVSGDGRIDPNGKLLPWLNAANPPTWQRLAAGGIEQGFVCLAPQDRAHGSTWLADTLAGAGRRYRAEFAAARTTAALITVVEAAPIAPLGTTGGLETGLACELLLPTDRAELHAIVAALRAQPLFSQLWFDDDQLVGLGLSTRRTPPDPRARLVISPPTRR